MAAVGNKAELLNENNLKQCFRMIDTDKSGSISKAEIQSAFSMNVPEDDSGWTELLRGVELNSKGEIDYSEFQKLMTSVARMRSEKIMQKMGKLLTSKLKVKISEVRSQQSDSASREILENEEFVLRRTNNNNQTAKQ